MFCCFFNDKFDEIKNIIQSQQEDELKQFTELKKIIEFQQNELTQIKKIIRSQTNEFNEIKNIIRSQSFPLSKERVSIGVQFKRRSESIMSDALFNNCPKTKSLYSSFIINKQCSN